MLRIAHGGDWQKSPADMSHNPHTGEDSGIHTLVKIDTAETEMPILKAEKKTARIPGSSASFEAGGPDYPEQMLYAAVPDRRDVEHPVVLYEYQPNWRTKKRRRNFCRRVHRILTEH